MTVQAGGVQVERRTKFAAEAMPFELDLGQAAVEAWQPDVTIAAGAIRRPRNKFESADGTDHSNGYVYQAGSSAGQTGPTEPIWATTGSVSDGSVTWAPVPPPAVGADQIAAASWTQIGAQADGSQIAITAQPFDALTTGVILSGGALNNTYTIQAAITMESGAVYVVKLLLTVL